MSDSSRLAPATPLNPRRRAIIVGASEGIGAALARKLAKEGYTLALLARQTEKLNTLCAEINNTQGEVCAKGYTHDVANYKEAPALLQKIIAEIGGLVIHGRLQKETAAL